MRDRTRDWEERHHSDGTRRCDNFFRQTIDRANGRAAARIASHERDVHDARFGRGPLAGRTGDPFIDDPFFNPSAPGGKFNRR